MNITGDWLVEKTATSVTGEGATRVRITMHREKIDADALPLHHRVASKALVDETLAQRAEDVPETAWPWTSRPPASGWKYRADIDGTDAGMLSCDLKTVRTQETDAIACRIVVDVLTDKPDVVGMLCARTGYPQRVEATPPSQQGLPGVAA